MNLSNFGSRLRFEETKKSKDLNDKEHFIGIVDEIQNNFFKSAQLFLDYQIDTFKYEEPYFIIIENLLLMHFGVWKTDLILWYIYEGKDEEGKPNDLEYELPDGTTQLAKVPNAGALWALLAKIEKQINKDK
jgi:hypothetical protein